MPVREELPTYTLFTNTAQRDLWKKSDPERVSYWDLKCESRAQPPMDAPSTKRNLGCSKSPGHTGPHVHYKGEWRGSNNNELRRPIAYWSNQ